MKSNDPTTKQPNPTTKQPTKRPFGLSTFMSLFKSLVQLIPRSPYRELEKRIGYRFRKKKLLEEALTHRSFRFENKTEVFVDQQRLEFLGDAVLGLLLAETFYARYTDKAEGAMTIWRSRVASEAGLARVAREIELGMQIRLGKGEIVNNGRYRNSILADTLESLFGAIYCDRGLARTQKVFKRLFVKHLEALTEDVWEDNPKGKLQQETQRRFHCAPTYALVGMDGLEHTRLFVIEVTADTFRATGKGKKKQEAEVMAARALLAALDAAPPRTEDDTSVTDSTADEVKE